MTGQTKNITTLLVFLITVVPICMSQSKPYYTSGGEIIFSFASIKDQGKHENSLLRFAPVFNPQFYVNKNLAPHFGVFTGLGIHNTGYIYDRFFTRDSIHKLYKKKFRSYNLAIPIGIKIGDPDKFFVFAGYELELPFHYKEKTYNGKEKIEKSSAWFSKRQNLFQHGFMVGAQAKNGISVKVKYYLSEFHNENYTDGNGIRSYGGLKSHIFYISIGSYFALNKKKEAPLSLTEPAHTLPAANLIPLNASQSQ